MDLSFSGIMAGLLYGIWGMYFFRRGKKEAHYPTLFVGIALLVYPYFVENEYLLWGFGAALVAFGFWMPM